MDSWEGEIASLYSQYAHAKGSFFRFCCEELVSRIPLKPGIRVLDLAGGAGILSRLILEREPNAHITILDSSAELIAQARAVFNERAHYVHSRAENYEPPHQFDVIVCANAFWYLHPTIITKLAEWLSAEGVLAFNLHENNTHFRDKSFFAAVHNEIDRVCREEHRTACIIYTPTVDVDKLTRQLAEAGFSVRREAASTIEEKENWKALAELQARRTSTYMAITMPVEEKLQIYRHAFKVVAKSRGEIERHTLIFVCTKIQLDN